MPATFKNRGPGTLRDGAGTAQLGASERVLYLAAADAASTVRAGGLCCAAAAARRAGRGTDPAFAGRGDRVVFELRHLAETADLRLR